MNDFEHDRILWNFQHAWDQPEDEARLLRLLRDPDDILAFHADKSAWTGCFGVMSAIRHSFLKRLDARYELVRLVPSIENRYNRMSLERMWACLLQKEGGKKLPLYGAVHDYFDWGITFEDYRHFPHTFRHMSLVKVWTGR